LKVVQVRLEYASISETLDLDLTHFNPPGSLQLLHEEPKAGLEDGQCAWARIPLV
jgi:hypothetical protein